MRVLVVGAGAVGQVYARHLQLGGAEITFYVREKYRAEVARGFDMYPLNRKAKLRTEPVRFDGVTAITAPGEIRAPYDQVWITVSSPALRGAWLPELVAATGPDATYVVLQPGLDDRKIVEAAGVVSARIVVGLISMISYHAPLPGETRFPKPGMAYYLPPSPSLFTGERADAVVAALRAGQQPAKRHKDAQLASLLPGSIMMAYLVGLEASGWSFRALFRGPYAKLAARGSREAVAALAAAHGRRVPLGLRLLARRTTLRLGLWFGVKIVPLDLETYLRVHFTKVGDQTREFMASYVALCEREGLPAEALRELIAALGDAGRESAASSATRPVPAPAGGAT
jgi:hypothetical protein